MTQRTLRRFLTETLTDNAELVFLIEDIAAACRIIADRVRNAPFDGDLGTTQSENIQGELQKPLDLIANDVVERVCANSPRLAALVSEEVEDVTWLKPPQKGDFVLYFDPLDGSSNLDVNLSVGTIFSIMEIMQDGQRDILRPGRDQICAGYAIYGPTTMLVFSLGQGVNGFSCHSTTGEFRLTHPNLQIPETTSEFAINTSRQMFWDWPIQSYVADCVAGVSGPRGRYFNMRWTASMVAEVHRILMRGGVFLYPMDRENEAKRGRLRLMYEANPMAWLIQAAGGTATTGQDNILDVPPTQAHQRVPVILGSAQEIEIIRDYYRRS